MAVYFGRLYDIVAPLVGDFEEILNLSKIFLLIFVIKKEQRQKSFGIAPPFVLFLFFFPARRLRSRVLVKVGFQHSIVNFTVFIRLFAEIPLGILVARDQIHRPGIESAVPLS